MNLGHIYVVGSVHLEDTLLKTRSGNYRGFYLFVSPFPQTIVRNLHLESANRKEFYMA